MRVFGCIPPCLNVHNDYRGYKNNTNFIGVMKSYQILLVEDDPDDIELFKETLGDNGSPLEVHVIMQGDQVLPYLKEKENLPDLVVLDLNLPKTPGKEILKLLKDSVAYKVI